MKKISFIITIAVLVCLIKSSSQQVCNDCNVNGMTGTFVAPNAATNNDPNGMPIVQQNPYPQNPNYQPQPVQQNPYPQNPNYQPQPGQQNYYPQNPNYPAADPAVQQNYYPANPDYQAPPEQGPAVGPQCVCVGNVCSNCAVG